MIFKDKTVVITGASEGIGAAAARLFADANGVWDFETAIRRIEALAKLNVWAVATGRTSRSSRWTSPTQMSASTSSRKQPSNSGTWTCWSTTPASMLADRCAMSSRQTLGASSTSTSRRPSCLPYLEEAGGGAIINVASLHGKLASAGASTYSASKFGLRIFTLALNQELDGTNIKAAVVSPGPVDTGFIMQHLDEVDDIVFSQPMSTAEEVAQCILDLCGNNVREQDMPVSSGILATAAYLMPWIARFIRPALERKGAKVKARLKAEQKSRQSD